MNYDYSYQGRFTGFPGMPGMRTAQQAFEMANSAQYRQFHGMKTEMTSDVLQFFKANEIVFLKAPSRKKCRPLDPIANLGLNIVDKFEIPNLQLMEEQKRETKFEKKDRLATQKAKNHDKVVEQQMKEWNPFQDSKIQSDPQKTLVVARLDYRTTQRDLKYEFEKYGIIKRVRIIRDLEGESRGYGFVQFDNQGDFLSAYKQGNNRKIDGRKVIVDYEKGRRLLVWRPRRFGGGSGGETRMLKSQILQKQRQQKERHERRMRSGRDRQLKQEQRDQQREKERKSKSRSRSFRKQDREKKKQKKSHKDYENQRDQKGYYSHKKEKREKKEKKERRQDDENQ